MRKNLENRADRTRSTLPIFSPFDEVFETEKYHGRRAQICENCFRGKKEKLERENRVGCRIKKTLPRSWSRMCVHSKIVFHFSSGFSDQIFSEAIKTRMTRSLDVNWWTRVPCHDRSVINNSSSGSTGLEDMKRLISIPLHQFHSDFIS